MTIKNPDDRLPKEPKLAYAAFLCYRDERDLNRAYNNFMQNNSAALTTMNAFVKWASAFSWQRRVNEHDDWQEICDQRETRLLGRKNALTAEEMAQELFQCVREEMELKKADMTHADMARYLTIGEKITARWIPKESPVTVNVDQSVTQTLDIDPDVLKSLGRKLAEDNDTDPI